MASLPRRGRRRRQNRAFRPQTASLAEPPSWLTLGGRSSPITSSPRKAATPGQAIVNLLYGLGEALSRVSCSAAGLDSALGVLHADQRGRDSLALDVLEVCRPAFDAAIIRLLEQRTFAAPEFREDRRGQVWIAPELAKSLAETSGAWSTELGAIAELVARMLGRASGSRLGRLPTPITQANRSEGREGVRRKLRGVRASAQARIPSACQSCGQTLASRRRLCSECLTEHSKDLLRRAWPRA